MLYVSVRWSRLVHEMRTRSFGLMGRIVAILGVRGGRNGGFDAGCECLEGDDAACGCCAGLA